MKRVITIIAIGLGAGLVAGCGPENGSDPGAAEAPDYESEARESISEENMDDILDQLEEEISADEAEVDPDN
jgi:hypothetical protein